MAKAASNKKDRGTRVEYQNLITPVLDALARVYTEMPYTAIIAPEALDDLYVVFPDDTRKNSMSQEDVNRHRQVNEG